MHYLWSMHTHRAKSILREPLENKSHIIKLVVLFDRPDQHASAFCSKSLNESIPSREVGQNINCPVLPRNYLWSSYSPQCRSQWNVQLHSVNSSTVTSVDIVVRQFAAAAFLDRGSDSTFCWWKEVGENASEVLSSIFPECTCVLITHHRTTQLCLQWSEIT